MTLWREQTGLAQRVQAKLAFLPQAWQAAVARANVETRRRSSAGESSSKVKRPSVAFSLFAWLAPA
jgi:hypothetical protein